MGIKQQRTVCLVVSYRDPHYVRTRTLRAALNAIDGCTLVEASNKRPGWSRYLETIWRTLVARARHNPDVYVLGFRGHEIFWIIRLLTIGKRLIFDAFMSPSDALISEKKLGPVGRVLGYLAYPLEYSCLRFSTHCITDTQAHRAFFAQRFRMAESHFDVVYVGAMPEARMADSDSSSPIEDRAEHLSVIFYGTFLPLHGMNVLLQACKLVEQLPIEFHIIGGQGQALSDFQFQLHDLELQNVHHKTWVDFEDLQSTLIPHADICLGGPFGGTPQAMRVITGKTFQFLMQGKATIIGNTDERIGFIDKENCLLVDQANSQSLAGAFEWALNSKSTLAEIGRQGQLLFEEQFSIQALASQLEPVIQNQSHGDGNKGSKK